MGVRALGDRVAIPADSLARTVVFAMSQPEEVDINEILFRPTAQEYQSSARRRWASVV